MICFDESCAAKSGINGSTHVEFETLSKLPQGLGHALIVKGDSLPGDKNSSASLVDGLPSTVGAVDKSNPVGRISLA